MKAGTIWINYPAGTVISGWIVSAQTIDHAPSSIWLYRSRACIEETGDIRGIRIAWKWRTRLYFPD